MRIEEVERRAWRKARLRLLRRLLKGEYRALGEKVFKMTEEGFLREDVIQTSVDKIREILKEIRELEDVPRGTF